MTNKNDKVMKAEDLMIGDWVYLPSIISDDKYQVQVLEIQDDCIKYYGGGKKMMVMFKYIEPIPLTPEILARMGFTIEEVPKYDDTYTEDEYTATMKCVDSRKCEVEIEYKTYWKKIEGI